MKIKKITENGIVYEKVDSPVVHIIGEILAAISIVAIEVLFILFAVYWH